MRTPLSRLLSARGLVKGRKGFAQAIAIERKTRSQQSRGSTLDLLVRGCMKRAVFTFSTAAMLDTEEYYREICNYLFDWAEKIICHKKMTQAHKIARPDEEHRQLSWFCG